MSGSSKARRQSSERPELAELMSVLDLDRVVTVVVFGSVARGDADQQSDLDVLVVLTDDESRRELRRRLRERRADVTPLPVSLALFTPLRLIQEAADRPSFISHLLDEGVSIYDAPTWASLRAALVEKAADREALGREVRNRARHLEPLSGAERFSNRSPVTVLSHLYGISRSLVIARLLQAGIHEYGWRRAFDRYAEVRPDLRSQLEALKGLRPYYEYAHGRAGAVAPDRVVDAEEVRQLLDAAEQLAG